MLGFIETFFYPASYWLGDFDTKLIVFKGYELVSIYFRIIPCYKGNNPYSDEITVI